jgi:alpha-1,3-rhamnosyl/mannosyltransferase
MRVIFNRLPAYSPKTGVGVYVANLLRELRRRADAGSVTAFPRGLVAAAARAGGKLRAWNQRQPAPAKPGGPSRMSARRKAVGVLRAGAQYVYARSFGRACRHGAFDLYHEPNFIPWPSDIPTVVTVHDLSVLLHPEWHPRDRVKFHERHFRRSLEQCHHVLTVSECMRQEIIATIGLSPERVTAIANGVRSDLKPMPASHVQPVLARLGLPGNYLLSVGTIEPRKNVLTLLRAYCSLPARLRDACPLVLVGGWGWNYAEVREYFGTTARHRCVIKLGFIADADLPAIYCGARALAYPSFYEGFGLPPIEMMACGGAVLASTAAAHREVLGDCAELIDPNDEAAWRRALSRVISDDAWQRKLQDGVVEHAAQYSWKRCAEQTWATYHRIAKAA